MDFWEFQQQQQIRSLKSESVLQGRWKRNLL